MRKLPLITLVILALVACGNQPGPGGRNGSAAGSIDYAPESDPLHDTIAYTPEGGDEIRLIDPDGTNDRRLWAHGLEDTESTYEIWSMRWNPAATRLAFASTHENWCSLFSSDIFYVGADGSGYSRVTQAPSCEQLSNFPQGRVQVPVRNDSFESFSGFMYFQGATSVQPVNLPPSGNGMVSFESVADFGDGERWYQGGTVIVAPNRYIAATTIVDAQENSTVTTSETSVFSPSTFWETRAPTWARDGSRLGFLANFNSFSWLPVEPEPVDFGTTLISEEAGMPDFTYHLAWGPTEATSNSLLYAGSDSFGGVTAVYLIEEGSTDGGEALVSYDSVESILDLAWLPDGSGFLYTVTDGIFTADANSNLFHYDFASDAVTQLTNIPDEFIGLFSISGDGNRVVFELASEMNDVGFGLLDPDLWLLDLTIPEAELLVPDARAPAWSW